MSLSDDGIWSATADHPVTPDRVFSRFERLPSFVFYTPVVIWCLLLSIRYRSFSLPTLTNPAFEGGGLLAGAKSDILECLGPVGRAATAPYMTYQRDPAQDVATDAANMLATANAAGVTFPLVGKPNAGRNGVGIEKIKTPDQLAPYLAKYPENTDVMLQQFSPFSGEAGVFYVRHPNEKHGRITSLTLKYFPAVVGDGQRTLRQLIMADPRASQLTDTYFPRFANRLDEVLIQGEKLSLVFTGNHRRGAVFRDGGAEITAAMTKKFEEISKEIDGFWFGRFDVRYRDLEALRRGEDFTIIELNGAGAEAIHIWDANMTLLGAYKALFTQYQTAFEIADTMRKRGHKPMPLLQLIKNYLSEVRMLKTHMKKSD